MGLELLFRGFTHWSMGLLGGACLTALWYLNRACADRPLPLRALFGAFLITAGEFVTGCVVNLLLGWQVWSYADQPGNLLGQICPLFTFLWFLLCLPLLFLLSLLQKRIFFRVQSRKPSAALDKPEATML
jgi:uncharacterized membrane protein